MTVPKRCVVAGVVVGVADEDVERDAREQFAQRRRRIRKSCTDLVGEVGVAGMPCTHLVQTEHGQRRHHCATGAVARAVEPLDEENLLAEHLGQFDLGGVEAAAAGELHPEVLELRHRRCVGSGRELGDELPMPVHQGRLRACATDRGPVQQGPVELRRQGLAGFNPSR